MKLTRVTISGADDRVDLRDLVAISEEYPFVEWGLLCSINRGASARYPTVAFMSDLIRFVGWSRVSLHFCGHLARYALSNHTKARLFIDALHIGRRRVARVQLNGFSRYRLPMIALAESMPEVEFILQCSDHAALLGAQRHHITQPNTSALWDASGGRGERITSYPCYDHLPMGYAGGIHPDNLPEVLTTLRQNTHAQWVDMESGVRTADQLDLTKVRSVLDIMRPLMAAPFGRPVGAS